MTFFKKLIEKLVGKKSDQLSSLRHTNLLRPDYDRKIPEDTTPREKKIYTDEELYTLFDEEPHNYVAVNQNILKVLKQEQVDLEGRDWKNFFSIAWIEDKWEDGAFGLHFPLFDRFVANNGAKESPLSLKWKSLDPASWHVPENCIEPVENMTDVNILINL
jgi:hypothetical protein